MKISKLTNYLAWAVGLLGIPSYTLIFFFIKDHNLVYHEVLTPLVYISLLAQIPCLFLYCIFSEFFSNGVFEEDINFNKVSNVLREFLFILGYLLCLGSTTASAFFAINILTLNSFCVDIYLSIAILLSIITTTLLYGVIPRIIVKFYKEILPGRLKDWCSIRH